MTSSLRRSRLMVIALAIGAGASGPARSDEPEARAASWRFTRSDRPVKVVVLAGSIGAWPKKPYAWHIERMCKNVEVKNLSQTGLGAWALKRRFVDQVLDNKRIDWNAEDHEHWLVFGGGLNSVGTPASSNQHVRKLFLMAHARGMKIVGLSLTPWGDESDRRFRGTNGLSPRKNTQRAVDFIMKRITPDVALGSYANARPDGALAPWTVEELADIAIDLYDSSLRDKDAKPRDRDAMRELLRKDQAWQRAHRGLDENERDARLDDDATLLAELPQWYLQPSLRSFDHIHPNAEGHAIIADVMCPSLPESWGCTCDDAGRDD